MGPQAAPSRAAPSGPLLREGRPAGGSGCTDTPAVTYTHAYTLRDTNMRINGLCFSSDGSLLFLSSWDCSLHIHDVKRCVSIRSLHAHRHGIESIYLLTNNNHLCLCPTKLQGPPQQTKQDKQQPHVGAAGPPGGPSQGAPADAEGRLPAADGVGAPPSIGRAGGNSYNLRLWDLRENRYVRVIPVSGRVIPGTGVSVHPKKGTFFCCTDDGYIKYYCSEKETYLWKRQTKTRRPLAAIEGGGMVGALYEGDGKITLWDINYLVEPFLSFNVPPFLLQKHREQRQKPQQQQQIQEPDVPTSLMFTPDGSLLLLGTESGRILALDAFTGSPAAVWAPHGGLALGDPCLSGCALDTAGASLSDTLVCGLQPGEDWLGSSSGGSTICAEGFVPAVDVHTDTLLCGSKDGWVYGYDLKQAQGGPPQGEPSGGLPSPTCGGGQRRSQDGGPRAGGPNVGPPVGAIHDECCCNITYRHGLSLGPHWAPPLWVAANPKHAIVATAGINCSIWKADVG